MTAVEGDGIDQELTRAVSVAMIAAARASEQIARMHQTAARQREARAAGDTVEAQRQLDAHTESARAYFEIVTRPEYLTAATDEQIQEVARQAQAWHERLPEAQRALDAAVASTARTAAAGDLQRATLLASEADGNDRRAALQPARQRINEGTDAASTARAAQGRPAGEAPGAPITPSRLRGPRPAAPTHSRQPGLEY